MGSCGNLGLAPRQKTSCSSTGRTRTTGEGRPGLPLAAWRSLWGALQPNHVYAARFAHLTSREHNKLYTGQAHAALAAATTPRHHQHRPAMGPRHRRRPTKEPAADRRLIPDTRRSGRAGGRGEPHAASRCYGDHVAHPLQPRPWPGQPDYALPGIIPIDSYAGNQRRSRAPASP